MPHVQAAPHGPVSSMLSASELLVAFLKRVQEIERLAQAQDEKDKDKDKEKAEPQKPDEDR